MTPACGTRVGFRVSLASWDMGIYAFICSSLRDSLASWDTGIHAFICSSYTKALMRRIMPHKCNCPVWSYLTCRFMPHANRPLCLDLTCRGVPYAILLRALIPGKQGFSRRGLRIHWFMLLRIIWSYFLFSLLLTTQTTLHVYASFHGNHNVPAPPFFHHHPLSAFQPLFAPCQPSLLSLSWCFTSRETIWLIRDG